ESLIAQTKYLKQKNFEIALDDFVMDERYKPLIPLANYIKLELPAMDEETLRNTINYFKPSPCTLLAEKVETQTDYRKCVDFGCTLFQGYFLSRPEIIKGRKLSPNKLAVLQLISEVQNPVIDIPGLIKVISRDTTLSFKLLKLVNSASYRRVKEISSIHMAVMMLGMSKIKSWASLLALSKLDDKPKAIQMSSVIRAGLCERLAKYFGDEFKDLFFTIGLLSTLDVFFDTPLSELVNDLPLTDDVAAALLNYKGKPGLALHTVKNYEISHWKAIHWDILGRFGITRMELNKAYMETIKWANSQEF
ncbi:MAG: HDOD domain-containing protein, partial [Pseudomonadales bacterium]|nr:HDOD domain-containing protein [Pseudomonadales bacterium]